MRSGKGGGILAWSDDGDYRWVRAGGDTINGKVRPGPDGGVLASSNPTSLNARITVLDSSGIPVFTMDAARKFDVSSNAAGFVVIGDNKVACPQGFEVQPYGW